MCKWLSIFIVLLLLNFSVGAQLLQWNTFGNAGTETTEPSIFNDANIAATNLTLGAGITAAGNANRFGGSNWFDAGNSNPSLLSEAVAGNDYIQFIVTPNVNFSFTPTSFVFNWDNSGTGPQNVALRSSVDGFTTDLGTVVPTAGIATSNTITISGLTGLTTATTFRIYGYGATGTGGTGGFDVGSNVVNVQLNGTTTTTIPTVFIDNAGTPAATNIQPNTNNNILSIFNINPNTASDFTNVIITTSGSATIADLSNFRIFYDANGNGIIDGVEASVSGAGIALTGSMSFAISGQTAFTGNRKYMVVADVTAGAVFGHTITTSIVSSNDVTTSLTNRTGNALGNQQTVGNVSAASDYFRSNATGDWAAPATWQSSHDNSFWFTATSAPTSAATSINILGGNTVTISTAGISLKNTFVQNGATLQLTTTSSYAIAGAGDNLTINNGGILLLNFTTISAPTGSGTIRIKTGGIVRAIAAGSATALSDNYINTSSKLYYEDQAVFDLQATITTFPSAAGQTYFTTGASEIPVLRITTSPTIAFGSGAANVFNCMLEANATFNFQNGGTKTFKGGFSGTGTINQTTSGQLIFSNANAILGGSLTLNLSTGGLLLQNGVTVPVTATGVKVTGGNITKTTGSFLVNGVIDITDISITNPAPGDVIINGTLKTSHASGLYNPGNFNLPSNINIAAGSRIEYNALANQDITALITYANIIFSGSGTKNLLNAVTVVDTVIITGSAIVDANTHNLGGAGTKFKMDNGRLILGTTGTQPNMTGTYLITGGTIQFNGASAQNIRTESYQNIEVTGAGVGNSGGNITLNAAGSFTVKSTGIFTINADAIAGPTGSQTVTVESGGQFRCGDVDGFNGGSGATATSVRNDIETINLQSGSIVEYTRAGDQQITAANGLSYHHLKLSGSGIKTAPSGTLPINGDLLNNSGTPTFAHNNGTVSFNGLISQTYGAFSPGFTFYNIIDNNPVNLIISTPCSLVKQLSITANSKLNVASFFTLLSSPANTANIDKITTANSITYGGMGGRFVVERFINTGTVGQQHGKSWQLLSVPTFGINQSVNGAWQEGNAPTVAGSTGYGTTISSEKPGATSRGYDFYTPAGPSIKTYDPATDSWVGIDDGVTNTNALAIENKKGYMILVRGDRQIQSSATPANQTIMRTMGKVYAPGTDAPPSTTVPAQKIESIGNPYASAIDFNVVYQNSPAIGDVQNIFYVWDPKLTLAMGGGSPYGLGGFQTFTYNTGNATYDVTPGQGSYTGSNRYIESGQAFLVSSPPLPSATGGTVIFSENCKVSTSNLVAKPPHAPHQLQQLKTNLFVLTSGNQVLIDGTLSQFDASYSNDLDKLDAFKLRNAGENLSIRCHEKNLVVERREVPGRNDTIFYNLGQMRQQHYMLNFEPGNLHLPGLSAYLVDRFQNTRSTVSLHDTTTIDFTVTADPLSAAANRFYLVFEGPAHHVDEITAAPQGITIAPNPVINNTLSVRFNDQLFGNYHLELLNTMGQVVYNRSLIVNSSIQVSSVSIRLLPGNYLLNITGPDGKRSVQKVMVN